MEEILKQPLVNVPADKAAEANEFDKNFKPYGAIAFFILLVILSIVFWYGIYFLMLSRS